MKYVFSVRVRVCMCVYRSRDWYHASEWREGDKREKERSGRRVREYRAEREMCPSRVPRGCNEDKLLANFRTIRKKIAL